MPAGAGFTDANGVWVIGETDLAGPLITDQLKKPGDSIGPQLTALKDKLVSIKSAAQSLITATLTTLTTFDAPLHTCSGIQWTVATGIGKCLVAGAYEIDVQIEFAANVTGQRLALIQVAPAATGVFATTRETGQLVPASAVPVNVPLRDTVQLAINDTFRFQAQQSSGGALNVTNAQMKVRLA